MMAKIVLQGIKFDKKSSFQRGPALAPSLIRKAFHSNSSNYFTESLIDTEKSFNDSGDYDIEDYFEIEEITRSNLKSSDKILTLGGDHSITYPIMKAYNSKYPKLDILQIDAHGDLYDNFEGDKYSHACPFARIMEDGLAIRLVQVGIRTLTQHQKEQSIKFDTEMHEMRQLDLSKIRQFNNPLYISLDMDCFDPAFAPGVSHHEPGGLSSRQVIDLIHNLDAEIVGADIVEYNPNRDVGEMTGYLAAKMMKELLGRMA